MKNTFKTLLLLLAGTFILSSCDKCGDPAVSTPTPEEYKWLSHELDNIITYENELGESIRYDVTTKSGQTVFPEGVSIEDDCIDVLNTQAIMILTNSLDDMPELATYIFKSATEFEVRLAIEGKGDWEINDNTPILQSTEVNGAMYMNVYELTPATSEADGVKKILYSKMDGFIYVEFNDGSFLARK